MTGRRIYATSKPMEVGMPVLPQSREDARFFELRRGGQEPRGLISRLLGK